MKKRSYKVALIYGGNSFEHEVSVLSAKNVYKALKEAGHEVSTVRINKRGAWFLEDDTIPHLEDTSGPSQKQLVSTPQTSAFELLEEKNRTNDAQFDVVFPLIHGPNGEDGSLQGFLQLSGLPYVGAGVIGSAIGMDKEVVKRLLRDAQLPVSKFRVFTKRNVPIFKELCDELGNPFFLKPSNSGSSVGISKVSDAAGYTKALEIAFAIDSKLIAEEAILGREIEVSVIGNEDPQASVPGEIIPQDNFYSYEAKYLDTGTKLKMPAPLTPAQQQEVQSLAIQAYQCIDCKGMARADFFLSNDNQFFVNELNTIPGFTNISMFPKLWEHSGMSQPELVTKLLDYAIELWEQKAGKNNDDLER